MKILVTGFDPFGGEAVNPAFEVIKRLGGEVGGAEVSVLQIPTAFYASNDAIRAAIEEREPDAVLMIGQAGGRFDVTVERVAVNLNDARIPDNLGKQPFDEPVAAGGPAAYFATLPVKAMAQAVRDAGIPASVSYTAGTFVCNHVMYGTLHYLAASRPRVKAGFVHIPFLLQQAVGKPNVPAMSIETMVCAIEAILRAVAADLRGEGGASSVPEGALH